MRQSGIVVEKICFCAADYLFWADLRAHQFRGRFEDWRSYFRSYCLKHGITDVIMFSAKRPYHEQALQAATELGLRAYVFEEGYVRPNWVTLERRGPGEWRIPSDRAQLLAEAMDAPSPKPVAKMQGAFGNRASWDVAYHFVSSLLWVLFPRYRRYRRALPLAEGMGWLRRSLGLAMKRKADLQRLERWLAGDWPLFVFAMQQNQSFRPLMADYPEMTDVIRMVAGSFARSAPAEARLLIKLHPYDNGLVDYAGFVESLTKALGLGDRLHFVDGGDLRGLLRRSKGCILVNSTTGMTALGMQCPVYALGEAIYDVAGVCSQGALDEFWRSPQPPDPELYQALLKLMLHKLHVPGSLFYGPGIDLAVENALETISRDHEPPGRTHPT